MEDYQSSCHVIEVKNIVSLTMIREQYLEHLYDKFSDVSDENYKTKPYIQISDTFQTKNMFLRSRSTSPKVH